MTDIAKVLMQLGRLDAEVDRLVSDKKQLEKENAELKANHADLVMRNAALRDRPDIPTERVKSVIALGDKIDEQQATIKSLAEALSEAAELVDESGNWFNDIDPEAYCRGDSLIKYATKYNELSKAHLTEGIGDE